MHTYKKVLYCFVFLLSFFLFLTTGYLRAEEPGLYLDLEMIPRAVRLQIKTGELTHDDLIFRAGLYAEGHLHEPDKLKVQPDPLTVSYRENDQEFTAGFFRPAWGTAEFNSIMLSGTPPALPGLAYRTSFLDYFAYERFGVRFPEGRGDFFGHRLVVEPRPGIQVGLKETVIYSARFTGYWLNFVPGWPFYLMKYIPAPSTRTHNMNIGLDVKVSLIEDMVFYGDFHVTEWPFVPESGQPRVFGLQLGYVRDHILREDLTLLAEYKQLRNYLYSARSPEQYYEHAGYSLGSTLGPDAQQLKVRLEYPLQENLTVGGALHWIRKGEGRIGDYWDEPGEDGVDSVAEARENMFMTGVIEHRLAPRAEVSYQLSPELKFSLALEAAFTQNHEHRPQERGTYTWGHLKLGYEF